MNSKNPNQTINNNRSPVKNKKINRTNEKIINTRINKKIKMESCECWGSWRGIVVRRVTGQKLEKSQFTKIKKNTNLHKKIKMLINMIKTYLN